MTTTVKALQDLYVKLGGSLAGTYEGVADGAAVADYVNIPDMIAAVEQVAGSGSGGGGGDDGILVTLWEAAPNEYECSHTFAEMKSALVSGKIVTMLFGNDNRRKTFVVTSSDNEKITFGAFTIASHEGTIYCSMLGYTVDSGDNWEKISQVFLTTQS